MKSEDEFNIILNELKKIGVKVPKSKKFKSIVSKQEKALPQSKSKIFGVSLCDQEWTADSDCLLPKFIALSIAFLRDYINAEGLFRKAGSVVRQRELRIKLEDSYDLNGSEPNDVASLLKQWLRELPEPLIPNYLHDLYIRCQQLDASEDRIKANLLTCLLLPQDHLFTLKYLLSFLSDVVAHSKNNKMDFRNVALIMAPNIFVLGADSADKSSPDLVELHICVLELMIQNASKVGEVPASVQLSALEGRNCSELDSSGDILDFSPCKSRKKRRSGPVHDLFNGIKKLVGQSATPYANAAPRSASKRKAETNDGSLPKKLTVEINGERKSASETPKNKGNSKLLNTDGKAHTRRKSFGLLRKKDRKRQKSAQESPQSEMSLSVKSPFSWNVSSETNKSNDPLQVPDLPSPISPFNLFGSDKALKCDSIKKSTSDCYLTVPNQRTFALYVSSSQGELQGRPKTSPYNLRTKFEGGQKSQMQSLESIQLEMKSIISDTERQNTKIKLEGNEKSSETDEVFENSTKPESDVGINIKRDDPLRKSSCRRKAHRSQSHAAKNVLEDIMVDGENLKNAGSCSMLSETLVQLDAKLSRRGMSRSSHKNAITRQEAFIVKSKQKLKDSLDQLESPDANPPVHKGQESRAVKDVKSRQVRKSQSVILDSKSEIHVSGRKVTKKTSRKASLIRGRPNTVKSGLPPDVCQRFSNDSILLPNENVMPSTSSNTKDKKESSLHKNKVQVDEPASTPHQETRPLEEKDDSLYLKFNNFALSTPPGAYTQDGLIPDIHSNLNSTFSIFDENSLKEGDSKLHLVVPFDAPQKRKLSLPISKGDTPNSKIPRLRRSLDLTRRVSSPRACMDSKNKTTTPKTSKPGCNPTKIPVRCTDSLKDLSALDFSMNDSCFKTPNRVASPDSVTWVSGSKYLGLNLPFEDEEATNKRESIAMILKHKPGHVQHKVHLWDTKVRDSVYCTRSVPTYSTPTAALDITRPSKNKKPLSTSKSCSSAYSTPDDPRKRQSQSQRKQMSVSKRKNQKLPLPPPPKFFVSEPNFSSPNESRGIKDVSSGINEPRNPFNDSLTEDPMMQSSPTKDKSENRRNGKRRSFLDNASCPLKEVTNTSSVINESKNSLNGSLNNDENISLENRKNRKRSLLLDNENRPLNESKNSLNGSPLTDECEPLHSRKKGKRSSFSDNQSHPLKEVTNISFGINESNNSLNGSFIKDDVISSKLPNRRKGKQSSFSGNTPKKLSKISRSESSPCRPTTKILQRHQQELLLGSPLSMTNDNFIPNRRLLRSSASKSGSCLSIEKLRSDQMIDEWQCEM